MNNYFTYSILQYKHNLALGETLNVGILFYFNAINHLEFAVGNSSRLKSVYPDFNISNFNLYLKTILKRINNKVDLFHNTSEFKNFGNYIHNNILPVDSAGLIFSEPKSIIQYTDDISLIIKEYSNIFLPGINTERPIEHRHNEHFILKKYTNYIFDNHKELENSFIKNEEIRTKNINLRFDLAWRNNSTLNLIKPISFDLSSTQSIQEKAATYLGYLTQLEDYAKSKKVRFDFLIAKPQNKNLDSEYNNALDILDFSRAPKKLILESDWERYCNETISNIL